MGSIPITRSNADHKTWPRTLTPVRGNIRDPELERAAHTLYSDRLPYHNFGHIEGTLAAADKTTGRCQAEGIRIDLELVYFALLFNDAGYQNDHPQLGYRAKEDYAAALVTTALRKRRALASQI